MSKKNVLFLLLLISSTLSVFAQKNSAAFWSDVSEKSMQTDQQQRFIFPKKYRTVSIDPAVLREMLVATAAENSEMELTIPMPNGQSERFMIHETPVMHPDLQAQYPEIRCYTGWGLDDPAATIKCDLTPQGFHAMTHSLNNGSVFIDPLFHGDASSGIVYYKKDFQRNKSDIYPCEGVAVAENNWEPIELNTGNDHKNGAEFSGDCQHRMYRLALSCTGEYAAFHGGTVPLVLAAMNTSMNRVNGVYERDFAVTMQIIPNNNLLIFLNAASDPFTNGNGGTMLGQNQTTVTNAIGAANYDIGHVFSTGGGGVAGLGVVCNTNSKARGVTGSGAPIGDPFDIDYVAHEMGHQFGGNHCFNNSCGGNINSSTAMEPGSGATIMAYAGICPPDVQSNSDDYFHAINVQEIITFTNTGGGNGCAVKTVTGNNPPTVGNVPNYTIPKSTPFALTASGNDIDGDPLTYCWEQMDNQSATMPPVSTSTGGPLFRSYDPVASPTRWFPRIPDLVTNTNSTWEELPGVARTMKFRVVVRDNNPAGGCNTEDDVTLTVSGTAGPFAVTAPNTNVIWNVGEPKVVTWDVNNTDVAPVSCANVKILLSTDGGFTYPVVLAENVPNTGSATVSVPNNISATCRVKVESIGNIFFDISNTNFRIQEPLTPTFVMISSSSALTVCAGNTANFDINTTGLAGFNTPVDLVITGAPAGTTVDITPLPVPSTGVASVIISGITPAMAGNYTLMITGTAGAITQNSTVTLEILPGQPTTSATGSSPADGTTGVSVSPLLTWASIQYATEYAVEISPNPGFPAGQTTLISVNTSKAFPTGLAFGSAYYWRVKGSNICGEGPWSPVFAFQTGGESCDLSYSSTNVPVDIDVNGAVNVSSSINITDNYPITDANLSLAIDHTYVGDLDAILVGPMGDSVLLFSQPGVPASQFGCAGDNLVLTFDDEATATATTLEGACNDLPAIAGSFKAIGSLAIFDGMSTTGNWTLYVNDYYPGEDSGAIAAWSLDFCSSVTTATADITANNPLTVVSSTTADISTTELATAVSGTGAAVTYTLLSLPVNGSLSVNGIAITAIGGTFTQADIDAGLVSYTHNGNAATSDEFIFDVYDSNNLAWLHLQTFQIIILQNTLSVTAAVTQEVSCFDGNNGEITASPAGGTAPLMYAVNGGTPQASPVLAGLAAGTYTVVVTDANGFTANAGMFTLSNPAAITVNSSVSLNDLSVAATGGTGSLMYSINGVNFQPTGEFTGLADGVYTVTVQDANGCTATDDVVVTIGALLASATQTATILCAGAATGEISIDAGGGIPPYTYSLAGSAFQMSNVFSGLVAGSYAGEVMDANGSITTTTVITISQPSAINAMATVNLNAITVTATGGTGVKTYTLNGNTQSTGVFNGLPNGSYTITVTDANGCTATVNATVAVAPLTITDITPGTTEPCTGILSMLTVGPTGGIPPYQYSIDGGTYQSTGVFTNIAPGTHTIDVQDATGITAATSYTVATPIPVSVMASTNGNSATGAATGGTAPYMYSIDGGALTEDATFYLLSNGPHTITAVDANGCTGTTTVTISYTAMTLSPSITNILCGGLGAATGAIELTVSGGLAPYSFVSNPPMPWTNIPAGSYSATVTDAVGNSMSGIYIITEIPPVSATAAGGDGNLTITAAGGTPPYQYSIDNGITFQSSNVFVDVADGTYDIVVTDVNGCTFTLPGQMVTGSTEVLTNWGISVTPNPGAGLFTVTMGNIPAGKVNIQVVDATGRLLRSLTHTSAGVFTSVALDLTDMPDGIYVLRLATENETGSIRLIKTK